MRSQITKAGYGSNLNFMGAVTFQISHKKVHAKITKKNPMVLTRLVTATAIRSSLFRLFLCSMFTFLKGF